ncbi:MAG TPA: hypothetical protein VFS34_05180 [Thermoanaerobaculia bacterium]|nr:hypothetical protein [Thermoanaerobaculia bacterium]
MTEDRSPLAERFSIVGGGPIPRLLAVLGRAADEHPRLVRRTLIAVLVTWLPMLVLSALRGTAYGPRVTIPFVRDFAVNVRFLVAVPILILAESGIAKTWRTIALHFLRSGLVTEKGLPSFEAAIERTMRLRDRILPEVLLAITAFSPLIFYRSEPLLGGVSTWHTDGTGSGALSPAGWWFALVSTPFFRFLLLRWFWRLSLWTLFLWRTSRTGLHLVASHTDLAAGLGILSEGQKAFSPIVFAGGAVVAASVGNSIAYQGATLASMKVPMIAYGVLAVVLLIAPLLVVAPVLLDVKKKALFEYGALVTLHDQLFETRWLRGEKAGEQVILGSNDASSLNDLGAGYTVVRQMTFIPINRQTLITLALAAALPMGVLALFVTPAEQLLRMVMKMLG